LNEDHPKGFYLRMDFALSCQRDVIRDVFQTHDPKTAVIRCRFLMAQQLNRCAAPLNRLKIGANWEARSFDYAFLCHVIENGCHYLFEERICA